MNAILTLPKSRLLSSVFGLLASAALFTTVATTHAADPKELVALNAKLAPKTVTSATSTEIANAVKSFATVNPTNLDVGKIAGYALQLAGSNALDVGTQIAAAFSGMFPITVGGKPVTQDQFAINAVKTAGSGKTPNLTQVPGFTAGLYVDATGALAAGFAIKVKGTKGAAGAAIQGGASQIATEAAKEAFAIDSTNPTSVNGKALSSVVQDVAKGVAATVADGNVTAFTNTLVGAGSSFKILLKIIPGIVAGKPTFAGAITQASFTVAPYAAQGSASPIVKGAATLAKSIGALADIEQVQKVGAVIAAQIPLLNTPGKPTTPNIKLSAATSIISTLAKAIAAKPYATLIGGRGTDPLLGVGASDVLVHNSEKADELGELAAYFISALSTSAEFTATKVAGGVTVAASADKIVAGILKAVIGGAKIATGKVVATIPTAPTKQDVLDYTKLMAVYVAGSVALTVSNLPASTADQIAWKASIAAALNKAGFAKSLSSANEQAVKDAITLGLTGSTSGRFENGFDVATGALTDPETNIRNF